MNWGRQGALGMLVAVVIWTAAPLIVCVPSLRAKPKADCCAAGMRDCESMQNRSCCELAPAHNTATMVSAYAPEYDQQTALLVREARLPMLTDPGMGQRTFHETPPPDPSPGGISVLRI
jgi:hypothetical protein